MPELLQNANSRRTTAAAAAPKSGKEAMTRISVKDGSDYFRGLLLLLRKDQRLADTEAAMMKRIGVSLGFEPAFCENAIREILENAYVVEAAPVFSARDLAEKFLRDGLTIARADGHVHPAEEEWLEHVAESNGLSAEWFRSERDTADARSAGTPHPLEAESLTIHAS